MNTKVSFHQIAQNVATRADISVEAAERFIKTLFETASFALENSEGVNIHGLGTFRKSDDPANPVAFVPDEYLAKAVNAPFEMFEPQILAAPEVELQNIELGNISPEKIDTDIIGTTETEHDSVEISESEVAQTPDTIAEELSVSETIETIDTPASEEMPEELPETPPAVPSVESIATPPAPKQKESVPPVYSVPPVKPSVPPVVLPPFPEEEEEMRLQDEIKTEKNSEIENQSEETVAELKNAEVNYTESSDNTVNRTDDIHPEELQATGSKADVATPPSVKTTEAENFENIAPQRHTAHRHHHSHHSHYYSDDAHGRSGNSRFGLGFIIGLLCGIAVGALAMFVLFTITTKDLSSEVMYESQAELESTQEALMNIGNDSSGADNDSN